MNLIRVVFLGLAAAASSGCLAARPSRPDEFYYQAARNVTQAPVANQDEKAFIRFVGRRAEADWERISRTAGATFSRDYADGFREGYLDYVEAGGNGEPPYLPPLRYRLTKNISPAGRAAAGDWFAGFRHGAAVARGSGLRELSYVPLPGSPIPADTHPHDPAPAALPPLPVQAGPSPAVPAAPPQGLPQPRPQMPPPVPPAPAVGKAPAPAPPATPAATPARTVVSPWPVPTLPRPVVLVEHSEPAAPGGAPTFTPWQPTLKPRAPAVTRSP